MNEPVFDFDVVVAGGGPAGSVTALCLARSGFKVVVLEKDRHPRFHLGESILPRTMQVIDELGLRRSLEKLPQILKVGAEFGMGNDPYSLKFGFREGLLESEPVFNIERSLFDRMLLDEAAAAGVSVLEETPVTRIHRLEENHVEVSTATARYRGRLLIDASGHGTLVGRHLKLRKNFEDPALQKVAYFQHFDGVKRLSGEQEGHIAIFMTDEGWFWMIAINETRTSVGFVTRPSFTRELGIPANRLLQWAITRCPRVRERMTEAEGPATNFVLSNFSYTCRPQAGPGYFMVGDAGTFLDPIFSTGVTLALAGGQKAAAVATSMLKNEKKPQRARSEYLRFVEGSARPLWRLIRGYYRHSFRELFLNGQGPLQVHRAIFSVLAGNVFPRPCWSLRWRLSLFHACEWFHRCIFPLVPRRPRFSLVNEPPVPLKHITEAAVPHAREVALEEADLSDARVTGYRQ